MIGRRALERWSLVQARSGVVELWGPPDELSRGALKNVLLPLATSYANFGRRFKSLHDDLSRAYDHSLTDIAQQITSVSTDILRTTRRDIVRRHDPSQASQQPPLIDSEDGPGCCHNGGQSWTLTFRASPCGGQRIIEDDLRLGHTKRGFFIITVAARLDPVEVSKSEVLGGTKVGGEDTIAPFSRRVLETLASGPSATRRHLADDSEIETYEAYEAPRTEAMSYELVQSLIEVADVEDLQSVDLSLNGPPLDQCHQR